MRVLSAPANTPCVSSMSAATVTLRNLCGSIRMKECWGEKELCALGQQQSCSERRKVNERHDVTKRDPASPSKKTTGGHFAGEAPEAIPELAAPSQCLEEMHRLIHRSTCKSSENRDWSASGERTLHAATAKFCELLREAGSVEGGTRNPAAAPVVLKENFRFVPSRYIHQVTSASSECPSIQCENCSRQGSEKENTALSGSPLQTAGESERSRQCPLSLARRHLKLMPICGPAGRGAGGEKRRSRTMPAKSRRALREVKVAIIGAGMAGVSAACTLRNAGVTCVTLFEARGRIGGRCCSAGVSFMQPEKNVLHASAGDPSDFFKSRYRLGVAPPRAQKGQGCTGSHEELIGPSCACSDVARTREVCNCSAGKTACCCNPWVDSSDSAVRCTRLKSKRGSVPPPAADEAAHAAPNAVSSHPAKAPRGFVCLSAGAPTRTAEAASVSCAYMLTANPSVSLSGTHAGSRMGSPPASCETRASSDSHPLSVSSAEPKSKDSSSRWPRPSSVPCDKQTIDADHPPAQPTATDACSFVSTELPSALLKDLAKSATPAVHEGSRAHQASTWHPQIASLEPPKHSVTDRDAAACSKESGGDHFVVQGIDLGASWIHGIDENPVYKVCLAEGLHPYGAAGGEDYCCSGGCCVDPARAKGPGVAAEAAAERLVAPPVDEALFDEATGMLADAGLDAWAYQTHQRHQMEAERDGGIKGYEGERLLQVEKDAQEAIQRDVVGVHGFRATGKESSTSCCGRKRCKGTDEESEEAEELAKRLRWRRQRQLLWMSLGSGLNQRLKEAVRSIRQRREQERSNRRISLSTDSTNWVTPPEHIYTKRLPIEGSGYKEEGKGMSEVGNSVLEEIRCGDHPVTSCMNDAGGCLAHETHTGKSGTNMCVNSNDACFPRWHGLARNEENENVEPNKGDALLLTNNGGPLSENGAAPCNFRDATGQTQIHHTDWAAERRATAEEAASEEADSERQGDCVEGRLLMWHLNNIEYSAGADVEDLSMMCWDQDDLTAFQGQHVLIWEGYKAAVDVQARSLDIRLRHVVTRIQYNSTGVRLFFEHGKCCSELFDYCICTVPLGVLKASVRAFGLKPVPAGCESCAAAETKTAVHSCQRQPIFSEPSSYAAYCDAPAVKETHVDPFHSAFLSQTVRGVGLSETAAVQSEQAVSSPESEAPDSVRRVSSSETAGFEALRRACVSETADFQVVRGGFPLEAAALQAVRGKVSPSSDVAELQALLKEAKAFSTAAGASTFGTHEESRSTFAGGGCTPLHAVAGNSENASAAVDSGAKTSDGPQGRIRDNGNNSKSVPENRRRIHPTVSTSTDPSLHVGDGVYRGTDVWASATAAGTFAEAQNTNFQSQATRPPPIAPVSSSVHTQVTVVAAELSQNKSAGAAAELSQNKSAGASAEKCQKTHLYVYGPASATTPELSVLSASAGEESGSGDGLPAPAAPALSAHGNDASCSADASSGETASDALSVDSFFAGASLLSGCSAAYHRGGDRIHTGSPRDMSKLFASENVGNMVEWNPRLVCHGAPTSGCLPTALAIAPVRDDQLDEEPQDSLHEQPVKFSVCESLRPYLMTAETEAKESCRGELSVPSANVAARSPATEHHDYSYACRPQQKKFLENRSSSPVTRSAREGGEKILRAASGLDKTSEENSDRGDYPLSQADDEQTTHSFQAIGRAQQQTEQISFPGSFHTKPSHCNGESCGVERLEGTSSTHAPVPSDVGETQRSAKNIDGVETRGFFGRYTADGGSLENEGAPVTRRTSQCDGGEFVKLTSTSLKGTVTAGAAVNHAAGQPTGETTANSAGTTSDFTIEEPLVEVRVCNALTGEGHLRSGEGDNNTHETPSLRLWRRLEKNRCDSMRGLLQFDPPLPEWKRAAIELVGMGNMNKIAFVFRRPFWLVCSSPPAVASKNLLVSSASDTRRCVSVEPGALQCPNAQHVNIEESQERSGVSRLVGETSRNLARGSAVGPLVDSDAEGPPADVAVSDSCPPTPMLQHGRQNGEQLAKIGITDTHLFLSQHVFKPVKEYGVAAAGLSVSQAACDNTFDAQAVECVATGNKEERPAYGTAGDCFSRGKGSSSPADAHVAWSVAVNHNAKKPEKCAADIYFSKGKSRSSIAETGAAERSGLTSMEKRNQVDHATDSPLSEVKDRSNRANSACAQDVGCSCGSCIESRLIIGGGGGKSDISSVALATSSCEACTCDSNALTLERPTHLSPRKSINCDTVENDAVFACGAADRRPAFCGQHTGSELEATAEALMIASSNTDRVMAPPADATFAVACKSITKDSATTVRAFLTAKAPSLRSSTSDTFAIRVGVEDSRERAAGDPTRCKSEKEAASVSGSIPPVVTTEAAIAVGALAGGTTPKATAEAGEGVKMLPDADGLYRLARPDATGGQHSQHPNVLSDPIYSSPHQHTGNDVSTTPVRGDTTDGGTNESVAPKSNTADQGATTLRVAEGSDYHGAVPSAASAADNGASVPDRVGGAASISGTASDSSDISLRGGHDSTNAMEGKQATAYPTEFAKSHVSTEARVVIRTGKAQPGEALHSCARQHFADKTTDRERRSCMQKHILKNSRSHCAATHDTSCMQEHIFKDPHCQRVTEFDEDRAGKRLRRGGGGRGAERGGGRSGLLREERGLSCEAAMKHKDEPPGDKGGASQLRIDDTLGSSKSTKCGAAAASCRSGDSSNNSQAESPECSCGCRQWQRVPRQRGWASKEKGRYAQIVYLHPKPVILVLMPGSFSFKSERRPKAELVKEALEVLGKMHGKIEAPVAAFVSRWGKDPFARGSYSYLPPGTTGACLSGKREAERVVDWVTGTLRRGSLFKWFHSEKDDQWIPLGVDEMEVAPSYFEDIVEGPDSTERCEWFAGSVTCGFCGEPQTLERPFIGCVSLPLPLAETLFCRRPKKKEIRAAHCRSSSSSTANNPHSGTTSCSVVDSTSSMGHINYAATTTTTATTKLVSATVSNKRETEAADGCVVAVASKRTSSLHAEGSGSPQSSATGLSRLRVAVHEDCSYHSPIVVSNNEGSRWFNVGRAVARAAITLCCCCGKPGASVPCAAPSCTNAAHVPCAKRYLRWPRYRMGRFAYPLYCTSHQSLLPVSARRCKTLKAGPGTAGARKKIRRELSGAIAPITCSCCGKADVDTGNGKDIIDREGGASITLSVPFSPSNASSDDLEANRTNGDAAAAADKSKNATVAGRGHLCRACMSERSKAVQQSMSHRDVYEEEGIARGSEPPLQDCASCPASPPAAFSAAAAAAAASTAYMLCARIRANTHLFADRAVNPESRLQDQQQEQRDSSVLLRQDDARGQQRSVGITMGKNSGAFKGDDDVSKIEGIKIHLQRMRSSVNGVETDEDKLFFDALCCDSAWRQTRSNCEPPKLSSMHTWYLNTTGDKTPEDMITDLTEKVTTRPLPSARPVVPSERCQTNDSALSHARQLQMAQRLPSKDHGYSPEQHERSQHWQPPAVLSQQKNCMLRQRLRKGPLQYRELYGGKRCYGVSGGLARHEREGARRVAGGEPQFGENSAQQQCFIRQVQLVVKQLERITAMQKNPEASLKQHQHRGSQTASKTVRL